MRPSRQVVPFGAPGQLIFIVDYFNPNLTIQAVPTGGASYWVEQSADDVNDSTVTPTWFAVPGGGTSGTPLTVGAFISLSNSPTRVLRFNVTVAGSVAFTMLQGSGSDGLAPGDPLNA